jgi:hypothetical protein
VIHSHPFAFSVHLVAVTEAHYSEGWKRNDISGLLHIFTTTLFTPLLHMASCDSLPSGSALHRLFRELVVDRVAIAL